MKEKTPTTWTKFQCGAGSRFISAWFDYDGDTCGISGCECGTKIRAVGKTTDFHEASTWFAVRAKGQVISAAVTLRTKRNPQPAAPVAVR